MSINVGYFFRESATNFRRNWVMSIGAIITIFLSLLLVGIALASNAIVKNFTSDIESKVSIRVFLKDGADQGDIDQLQNQLRADAAVSRVNYTSKDKALDEFKKTVDPEMIAQLDGNPLPASLDVDLKNPREVQAMADKILQNPAFIKVADNPKDPKRSLKYGQEIVPRLFLTTQILRIVMIVFVIMLAFVSLIFIANTIRLAIYARRKEIGIMRLVGASNWFIRAPFLLEGIFQALIGAALAILFIMGLRQFILARIQESVQFIPLSIPGDTMVYIAVVLLAAGVVIGALGSGLALRRYLRV